jgi:hypothetical protein
LEVRPPSAGSSLPIGDAAPAIVLADLNDRPVSLSEVWDQDTAVLFWDPACGFCRDMHADIVNWEAADDPDTPKRVVISSGVREATRAEGFRSLVLLDRDYAASEAFAARRTPVAVLVNAGGQIASPVLAGKHAVLGLLSGRRPES